MPSTKSCTALWHAFYLRILCVYVDKRECCCICSEHAITSVYLCALLSSSVYFCTPHGGIFPVNCPVNTKTQQWSPPLSIRFSESDIKKQRIGGRPEPGLFRVFVCLLLVISFLLNSVPCTPQNGIHASRDTAVLLLYSAHTPLPWNKLLLKNNINFFLNIGGNKKENIRQLRKKRNKNRTWDAHDYKSLQGQPFY